MLWLRRRLRVNISAITKNFHCKTWYFLITSHYPFSPPRNSSDSARERMCLSAQQQQESHYGQDRWLKHPTHYVRSMSQVFVRLARGKNQLSNYQTLLDDDVVKKNLHECDTFYQHLISFKVNFFSVSSKRSLTLSKSLSHLLLIHDEIYRSVGFNGKGGKTLYVQAPLPTEQKS